MDITVTREGSVAVLTWNDGENRINLDSLARLNELLDELESGRWPAVGGPDGSGKFFCNGLDLERFADNRDEFVDDPARTGADHRSTAGLPRLHRGRDQRPRFRRRCADLVRVRLSRDARGPRLLVHERSRDRPGPRRAALVDPHQSTASRHGDRGRDDGATILRTRRVGFRHRGGGRRARTTCSRTHSAVAESMSTLIASTLGVHKRLAHGAEAEFLGFTL